MIVHCGLYQRKTGSNWQRNDVNPVFSIATKQRFTVSVLLDYASCDFSHICQCRIKVEKLFVTFFSYNNVLRGVGKKYNAVLRSVFFLM